MITYLRKELERFAEEHRIPIIGYLNSVALEELHAMECETFIICGGAGALTNDSRVDEVVVPSSAVRDEGISYHYLKPSCEIAYCREKVEKVVSC